MGHLFSSLSFSFIAQSLFGDIWRGVNHGTMHGDSFGGIDRWYNANF
jgi:hypothetical protein